MSTRKPDVTQLPTQKSGDTPAGRACPQNEKRLCPVDCAFDWSPLTGACANLNDVKTRQPTVQHQPRNGGKACPVEEHEVCCIVDCAYTWSGWSTCDVATLKQTRTAIVTIPASGGGQKCPSKQFMACSPPGAIVNCVYTWGPYSTCDMTTLKQTRYANVTLPASGGGQPCPTLPQIKACSPGTPGSGGGAGGTVINTNTLRTSGNCGDAAGESQISTSAECEAAAAAIGWPSTAYEVPSDNDPNNVPYPSGCALYTKYDGSQQLAFNQYAATESCSTIFSCLCNQTMTYPPGTIPDVPVAPTDCTGLKSTTSNGVFVTADPFSLKMSGWSTAGFSAYCIAGYSGTPTINACSTVGFLYTVGGCTKCEAGYFSSFGKGTLSMGVESCTPCEIGTYSPPGATSCTATCPAGFGNDATNVPLFVNVFFMLDASDSICDQWVDEIEAAEDYCTFDMA